MNICGGQSLKSFLASKYHIECIAFNEAFIEGDIIYPLFGEEFIKLRAKYFSSEISHYKKVMNSFLSFTYFVKQEKEICLFFGVDTFCQMNVLGLLAYLEEIDYSGKVFIALIDEKTNQFLLEKQEVVKDDYLEKSESLLVFKKHVEFASYYLNVASEQYLSLNDENGVLRSYIKQNNGIMNDDELFRKVYSMTRIYGLGDDQVLRLIKNT